jgi:maltodextrin utilization protein YvdJ
MKHIFTLSLLCLSFVSCAPQYARRVTYTLGNSYPEVKRKLTEHQNSEIRSFSLIQDRITVSADETIEGKRSEFRMNRSAFDIGVVPVYEGILTAKQRGSVFTIKEGKAPTVAYDGPRALTGNKLGSLKELDSWVTSNLDVRARIVDEDTDSQPLYR